MAERLGEAVLELRTDHANLKRGMKEAESTTKTALDKMEGRSKKFSSFIKGALGIGGALIAFRMLKGVVTDLIGAYRAQELAETKLAAALRSTGGVVGITKDEMLSYATEMQKLTTYGDEMIVNAQAVMTTFTQIGKEVFPAAIEAAADMSTMFGQDLQQSVIQLGTALNDPIRGVGRLRRIGISFTESQKEQIAILTETNDVMGAQAIILGEIQREFGGVAKAAGQTATGALTQLKNAIGDLKEVGGALIVEAMQPTVQWLKKVVVGTIENIQATRDLIQAKKTLKAIEEGGTEAVKDKAKQIKGLTALYAANEERIRVQMQSEKNVLNRILGATKATIAKREEIEKENESILATIKLLEKEVAAEKAATKVKEEAVDWTQLRIEAQADLALAFELIDKRIGLTIDKEEALKLKNKEVLETLDEMLRQGFTPAGDGIRRMLGLYGEWITSTGDVVSTNKDFLEVLESEVQFKQDIIDLDFALVQSRKLAAEAAREEAEALLELSDAQQKMASIAEESFTAFAQAFADTAIEGGAVFKEAMKAAVASVIMAFGKMALVEAAIAAAQFRLAKAVALVAAGTFAFAAAAAVKAFKYGGWLTEPVIGRGLRTGTTYALAEEGAEYVSPPNRMGPDVDGGRSSVSIYVGGSVIAESQLVELIATRIGRRLIRGY